MTAKPLSGASYWPKHLPRTFHVAENTLASNLTIAAQRFGDRTGMAYFGRSIGYGEWESLSKRFAGWLQHSVNIQAGDRVAIFMQNCPQWLIAYFGVLLADAVVVPVSPMYRQDELNVVLVDSGAKVVVCASDLVEIAVAASSGTGVRSIVVANYSDYLPSTAEFNLPEWITNTVRAASGCICWADTLSAGYSPKVSKAVSKDLAVLPYTSGSTGIPKGCMHTHRSFMHTAQGGSYWYSVSSGTTCLALAPMYHVSGMSQSINGPVLAGATIVVQPRWDSSLAARLIERYKVRHAAIAPTAIIDLLNNEEHQKHDLTSLRCVTFGGAPMPEEVFNKLKKSLGVEFIEGYGMTETAAAAIVNPLDRPKQQCLGVPFFNTDILVVDPETNTPMQAGESGEILIRGPQVFDGYWQRPEETQLAFTEVNGLRYLRSGDIGYLDDEGYVFMSDRLKRMINVSGFKAWPAEIENKLYEHQDIVEVCVIKATDAYRGETVKAVVVLKPESRGRVSADDIINWSRGCMAAYKYPRIVEFADALPKAINGKVLWRELQEKEDAKK